MYLGVADVKIGDKANGRSDSATINTRSKGGCVLVSSGSRINNFDTCML